MGTELAVGSAASVALERFRARPVAKQRYFIRWLIRGHMKTWHEPSSSDTGYRSVQAQGAEPELSDPTVVTRAAALGFHYIGVAEERALLSRIRKDVWLDDDRTVQLHSRKRLVRDHAPRSVYHFVTYFEDGSCVLSWSHPPRTPSSKDLASRGGSGSLDADFADHVSACAEWCRSRGTRALVVDGPDSVAGLINHYYRQVVPHAAAVSFTMGMLFVLFFVIATLAMTVSIFLFR